MNRKYKITRIELKARIELKDGLKLGDLEKKEVIRYQLDGIDREGHYSDTLFIYFKAGDPDSPGWKLGDEVGALIS